MLLVVAIVDAAVITTFQQDSTEADAEKSEFNPSEVKNLIESRTGDSCKIAQEWSCGFVSSLTTANIQCCSYFKDDRGYSRPFCTDLTVKEAESGYYIVN